MGKEEFEYTGRENLEAMEYAHNYNDFLISFVKSPKPKKGAKVLDFGAGSGTYADLLKEHGIVPDSLEPDAEQGKILQRKGYKVFKDISELKPETYDLIYAFNVFEHIEDDKETVAALRKVLKKNGKLVIYVPAFQLLYTNMDKLVGHHRRYRVSMLKDYAQHGGLSVEELYYCDPLGFFAAFAYKYLGNKNGTISSASVKLYDKYIFPLSKLAQPLSRRFFGKNVVLVAKK